MVGLLCACSSHSYQFLARGRSALVLSYQSRADPTLHAAKLLAPMASLLRSLSARNIFVRHRWRSSSSLFYKQYSYEYPDVPTQPTLNAPIPSHQQPSCQSHHDPFQWREESLDRDTSKGPITCLQLRDARGTRRQSP